jgi:hypothetical protein
MSTRFLEEDEALPDMPCACPVAGCTCHDIADAITADGTPLCVCCISDCADVHPEGQTPGAELHTGPAPHG